MDRMDSHVPGTGAPVGTSEESPPSCVEGCARLEDIEAAVELIGAVDRATSTDPRSRLKVRYMGDKPPEPTRWVIGGLLPEGACLILGAEEKTGKSWLAFDIAIALPPD